MEFLYEYGLFLAKAVTLVAAIGAIIAVIAVSASRQVHKKGELEITDLSEEFEHTKQQITDHLLTKDELKEKEKAEKKKAKAAKKEKADEKNNDRKRLFVLDFKGSIDAKEVASLREEISAVLSVANENDEVLVRLETGGGMVHGYGLASSQLDRIRQANVPLTIAVDKVAASGGYMMACLADRLIAAPFAVLGSIGVVAQIPNFHRLLKKNDIDVEMLTAGEYKRTLTMFGENTDKDREKFVEDLEDTHELFKEFVAEHRPQVDIEEVANGEVWFGRRALDKALVDEICTSDEYLLNACSEADVYHISYVEKKSIPERFGISISGAVDRVILTWLDRIQKNRYFS